MRKIIFILLVSTYCINAQNTKRVEQYNYGKNGIEYIAKSNNGKTIIISTFNSRPTIKDEVAVNVFNYFREKNTLDGDKITIQVNEATVKGTCNIRKKDNITSVEFHYETVDWKNGLTEIYVSPNSLNSSSIANNDD
jgi:hypothetical protein